MKLGRKGNEVIRSGPVPLARDTAAERDYYKGSEILAEHFKPHIGHPVPLI